MFEKILFATTGTPTCDNAAHVAFDLAKKYNSEVYPFHVFGRPTRGFSSFVTDSRTGEEDPDYVEWVKEELKNTYVKQIAEVPNCRIETMVGIPHTEVLRMARKWDVDLIVMGAHSREEEPGATRYRSVVGSSQRGPLSRADCEPALHHLPLVFSNIIFGTDFTKASQSAFLFASKLAKEIGAKLWLFHALDLSAVHSGKIFEQSEIEEQLKEARKKVEEKYISQLKDYDNYEIEVWEGIPYVEILKFAREKNGDLIVMSHHTREIDSEDALLGSTVEQVVLRSSCPVASVNRPHKVS